MSVIQNSQQKFDKSLEALRDYVFYGLLGGPKFLPLRYIINIFKGATMCWVIFLMYYFRTFSTGMWVYMFLHGTYGFAWLAKDILYPDATFKQKGTLGSLIALTIFLCLYWCIPIPLAAGYGVHNPPLARIVLVVSMYLFGLYLMMGSDYQKTTTLAKKKGLISTGFFKNTRNPNYLGEVMIYGSFVICAGHIFSYMIFFCGSCLLFGINMHLKDRLSYQKKQGWAAYKQESYMLFPKVFPSLILNTALYGVIMLTVVYIASMPNVEQVAGASILSQTSI